MKDQRRLSPIEAENANGIDSLPIAGKGFLATGFKAFEGRLAARVLLQGFQVYSARRLCNKVDFLTFAFPTKSAFSEYRNSEYTD